MACLRDEESALDASLCSAFQPQRSSMDRDGCTISTPFNQDFECMKVDTVISTYNLEMKPLDGKLTSSKSISLPSNVAEEFFSSVTSVLTGSHDSGHNHPCVDDDLNVDEAGGELHKQVIMEATSLSRKEKRKNLKKVKRKQIRKQVAEKQRFEEEARLTDPVELLKIRTREEAEAAALEIERQERETQERLWFEREQKAREDAERKLEEKSRKELDLIESEEEYGADYVEGPPEIIWQGNEIIVKKRRVKVPKEPSSIRKDLDDDQPISNPLPPQSAAFAAHRDLTVSKTSSLLYESFEQNPNFGTEQDKTHCPFHIKTGVCRFGIRCSRVHVYPEKSSTLLMKNMYTGPGLAWEHDEGLEHTDEEVAQHYEEFYEDVHSEFLKFGELVNFKVCRNVSAHLRGNVYVHYRSEEAAVTAFNAMNGRYFASKQILCEFVGVTRWKVAICGEYMKAHHRPCSHGTACNFLHCFRNPGGEYDWADWDSPPPLYWQEKMEKLFGYREANRNHDDKERKGGQHEYSRRYYDGYNQQPARDHASDNRHRRWHTHNRHDDRSRFQSSSDKHHHERRHSRDLNRQRYKRNHSETDSEKTQGSYSEDGYDAQNHGLRSLETRKELKRRYHDDEREWSPGMDSDNSYIKQRKRQVSTDMRKQKFEDFNTNWSDPEDKKQTRVSSKQEKTHVKEFVDYESGASQTSNSGDGSGQRKRYKRPKDRRRKSSENQHEYMNRHHNGYNEQLVRNNASDNRYRRYNTHNRHNDHCRLQSSSGKHHNRSQCSRDSNSQHDRRHHSETDSEKWNASYSEDSDDAETHRLRLSETRKEPKRRYRDNERDASTGFHFRDSNTQCYTRNQSETDSEKSKGLYPEDDCNTPNTRPRPLETGKKWKRRCHDDELDGSTGIDSDDNYNKKRKRHIFMDRKKQKFEDSDSDWSQPDSHKQKRGASQMYNSGGGFGHRKHYQRLKDRRRKIPEKDSEKSDHSNDVTVPKSKLLASRKNRERNSNDVPERLEGSELIDVLESTHRHALSHIKNKSERKRSETGEDSEREDESEQRPLKYKHSKSRNSHETQGLDSVDLEDRWQGTNGHPNRKLSTDYQ